MSRIVMQLIRKGCQIAGERELIHHDDFLDLCFRKDGKDLVQLLIGRDKDDAAAGIV